MARKTSYQLKQVVTMYCELRGKSFRLWRGYRPEDGKRGWMMKQFGHSEVVFLGANLTDAYANVVERIDEYTGNNRPPQ
jgi:hypothetical protein